MRKQPAPPPEVPAFTGQPSPLPEGLVRQRREYALITPLFGGGVVPNQADPVTIIRPTEIRAHLRFWWRACRGGKSQFNRDINLMREEEERIWGRAAVHEKEQPQKDVDEEQEIIHPVQIAVEILSPGCAVPPTAAENIPQYAAFPLLQRDNRRGMNGDAKVVKDIRFALIITYPIAYRKTKAGVDFQTGKTVYREDVEAALWAWETFGGIGARTRRGFGAIQLQSVDGKAHTDLPLSSFNAIKDWLAKKLAFYIEEEDFPHDLPHLPKETTYMAITDPQQTPMLVWKELIEHYSRFRQSRRSMRQRGNSYRQGRQAGRSEWPEAETIRSLTNHRARTLRPLNHPHKFPRAAFGLPINFHFKDQGDPPDVMLVEAESGSDRMASPLILRPLACLGQKAVGLAVLLEGIGVDLDNLKLKVVTPDRQPSWQEKDGLQGELTKAEAENISVLSGKIDVLVAFLDYLDKQY